MNDATSTRSLGAILRAAKKEHRIGLGDLTVLSPQNDPYRLDTPANHAKARWFQDLWTSAGLNHRRIHNRGIHYVFVSTPGARLLTGAPYVNNSDCWTELEAASNIARWLGYVPWDSIVDNRNAAPTVRTAEPESQNYRIAFDDYVFFDPEDLTPQIRMNLNVRQPYQFAIYGEKASLEEVLGPVAQKYNASLYLPQGEISNTLLHTMAKHGAEDGRPMVVLVFADCDPAGYQMGVSIGHKLRCMKDRFHPGLEFEVYAPALTVEQVKEFGLPSTPLKPEEKRADRWTAAFGVEQTEIDALATLRPDLLRTITEDAIAPFWDPSLVRRLRATEAEWEEEAQAALLDQIDVAMIEDIKRRGAEKFEELKATLAELSFDAEDLDLDLPPISLPMPSIPEDRPPPLVSSGMDLVEHARILRARKDYSGGAA